MTRIMVTRGQARSGSSVSCFIFYTHDFTSANRHTCDPLMLDRISSNVNFLLSRNDLRNGSCNDDTDTSYQSSISRRCDRLRNYNTSFVKYLDKNENIDYLHANQSLDSDASKPTAFEQSYKMDSSVSSMSLYHLYFDNETDFEDAEVDAVCLYSIPRNRSQDDCLNSASHPKLFTSQYQQQWSVRAHKFQLGLIITREVSGPTYRA